MEQTDNSWIQQNDGMFEHVIECSYRKFYNNSLNDNIVCDQNDIVEICKGFHRLMFGMMERGHA